MYEIACIRSMAIELTNIVRLTTRRSFVSTSFYGVHSFIFDTSRAIHLTCAMDFIRCLSIASHIAVTNRSHTVCVTIWLTIRYYVRARTNGRSSQLYVNGMQK